MTTYCDAFPQGRSGRPGLPFLFVSLLLVAILGLVFVKIVLSDHAVQGHGEEGIQVRKCLQKNGAYQIWKNKNDGTFYLLCQLDDGRWGLQAIIKEAGEWIERTAYVPKDGAWGRVIHYLRGFATRFKGPLP